MLQSAAPPGLDFRRVYHLGKILPVTLHPSPAFTTLKLSSEMFPVISRFTIRLLSIVALCGALASVAPALAQEKNNAQNKGGNLPTAEQVAETVIVFYGQRPVLQQVRRSGVERGVITRAKEDGGTEEVSYERRFMRGDTSAKDKIRLDQKTPAAEYSLLFNGGQLSGVINGVNFTPREDVQDEFLAARRHDIDALLRYKENNSQLTLVGKEKQKNIDMYVIDLVDAEKRRTRYYISAQRARVLWLEYDEAGAPGTPPTKFKRTFHDYSYVQGTLVPFRILTYMGNKQLDEKRVRTVTYGVKMDESLFANTEASQSGQP